jgi:hypothetical protein
MTSIQADASDFAPRNDRACTIGALIGAALSAALVVFVLGSALLSGVQTPAQTQAIAFIDGP